MKPSEKNQLSMNTELILMFINLLPLLLFTNQLQLLLEESLEIALIMLIILIINNINLKL